VSTKFKVIDGENVTSIASREREIKLLEYEVEKKAATDRASDRDLVVYAYHFARLGHPILAQKYLNRLATDYFDVGVWKDLYQGMLAWSLTTMNPALKKEKYANAHEYYIIIQRVFELFVTLTFETKTSFEKFKVEFQKYSLFTNLT
jgi:hypothetical protein